MQSHADLPSSSTADTAGQPAISSLLTPPSMTDEPKPPRAATVAQRPPSATYALNPRSCHICRRRKVRCDKRNGGCGNCAKGNVECIYPGPGRAPRRPKAGQAKGATERETELLKRLRRLEGVVEELSSQVEVESSRVASESTRQPKGGENDAGSPHRNSTTPVRVVGMDERMNSKEAWAARVVDIGGGPPMVDRIGTEFGKLVIDEGRSRYVSNSFWARFNGEVEDIRELFEEDEMPSDDDEDEISSPGGSASAATTQDISDHHSFIMGYSSSQVEIRQLHPLPSQIPFYWEIFKENVDPLCKIMHIPTMSKTMKEVRDNLGSLSRSTEALCFAIYFATVVSMTPDEVRSNFGFEKTYLLNRYRFATEQALARAGFLQTSEIVTVQAFVLFLVCVRHLDDSKFVWTLTGLVIRIAQSLGLHRDGTNFNLTPFNTEMRRRCWWQICVLDVRAAEDYGSEPSILEFSYDTKLPLNINDDDLDPQSLGPPEPRIGISEMTFCMIRYEICNTSRQLSYTPAKEGFCKTATMKSLAEKEEMVKELHERLESNYLVYCQGAGPLYWVAATVSRLIVAKMGLVIYSPHLGEGLHQSIKDRLFIASIEIMEYSQLLQTEASTRKWGWLFRTYIQWHAMAYILGEVCVRPRSEIVDRGWRAVDNVFNDWDDLIKHGKTGMHWVPMRRLMAKARRKRESDMLASGEFLLLGPSDPVASPSSFFEAEKPPLLDPIRPLQPGLPREGLPDQGELARLPNSTNTNSFSISPGSAPQLPSHIDTQSQLEIQFQQQLEQSVNPSRPWILDDSALVDLDMNALDGDVSMDNWDELVNYFQMEVDGTAMETRAPGAQGFNALTRSWL